MEYFRSAEVIVLDRFATGWQPSRFSWFNTAPTACFDLCRHEGIMMLQDGFEEQRVSQLIKKNVCSQVSNQNWRLCQQLWQRQRGSSKTWDESSIEVHKSQKWLQCLHVFRNRPALDSNELVWGGSNAILGEDVTQKLNGFLIELAFYQPCMQTIVSQDCQHLSKVLSVFFSVFAKDYNLIKVNRKEV